MTQDSMSDDLPVTPQNKSLTDVKKEQLAQASELKRKLLGEKSATEERLTATQIQEQRHAANARSYDLLMSKLAAREEFSKSLAGKLGGSPGGLIDTAVATTAGWTGSVLGAGFDAYAAIQEPTVDEQAKDAFNRHQ